MKRVSSRAQVSSVSFITYLSDFYSDRHSNYFGNTTGQITDNKMYESIRG